MFSGIQYNGASLPPKTLCFTFDDGPGETAGNGRGPKTARLAEYLYREGIPATFFMTGRHIAQYPHILKEVLKFGHTIGNHTYNHPDFLKPESFVNGETILSEIEKTAHLIHQHYPAKNIFFRAPYGAWDEDITGMLNRDLQDGINYTGPIGWDINGNDWEFWWREATAEECAHRYLALITETCRGIIVMHDSTTDNDVMRVNNLTFETVQLLVPQLKRLGYSFAGLGAIPGLANSGIWE
ncbi:MAG TPA: polysaccharide deacetylase family protein [Chitinophagaceae bacterium]|nr:polysaccharide deacetylase family protein [Chitinophagaceae bacterium]